jgi:hypothetical protein
VITETVRETTAGRPTPAGDFDGQTRADALKALVRADRRERARTRLAHRNALQRTLWTRTIVRLRWRTA